MNNTIQTALAAYFNTPTLLPAPGTAMDGGVYAGAVLIDNQLFGVIVSPKAGDFEGAWGERGKAIPAAHPADGPANTQVMAEHGSEIAKRALALDIGGHTDWYIPARDELELIYRQLKPTDAENYNGFRDGENGSSLPIGQRYTSSTPQQTSVDTFRSDGSEALESTWYWSSTQGSAHYAFVQAFDDGCQGNHLKGRKYRVRAVRRFLIA